MGPEFLSVGTLNFKNGGEPGRGHLAYLGPYTQGQVRNHNDLGV